MMQRYEVIGDVRGRGLLMGIELVRDRHTKEPAPDLALRVMNGCLDRGLSTSITRGSWGVFRIVATDYDQRRRDRHGPHHVRAGAAPRAC